MGIRPLHDKVLIKRLDMSETTEGGIIIPAPLLRNPRRRKLLPVGKGRILENGDILPLDVEPGDKIIFGKIRWKRSFVRRRGLHDCPRA